MATMACGECRTVPEPTDADFPRWVLAGRTWTCPVCAKDLAEHHEQLMFDVFMDDRR